MNPLPSHPKVSVITPSYNQGKFLEETIQSVLNQDYPEIEYIILDAQSKDNSVEIIKKYQDRLAYWVSEKDEGQSDAIQKGFARAAGDILAWLNSDDIYTPGAISAAVAYLASHPDTGLVYGDADLTDEEGHTIGQFASKQTSYEAMLNGSVHIPQATTFFRADLYREVGPINASMFFAFDYDLWVRLARVSQIHYEPKRWAYFRMHELGKSVKNDDQCYPEMIKVREREKGKGISALHVRAFVRRLLYARLPWRLRLWLRKAMTF